jgi:serine protease Do
MKRTIMVLIGVATLTAVPTATADNAYAQHELNVPDWCSFLGVQVRPINAAFAASLGMAEPYGAIFDRPEPDSPAARAGIQTGDVVTEINGLPLSSWSDFATTISKFAPGTTVHLTTWRNAQLIEAAVTLGSSKCPATKTPPAST